MERLTYRKDGKAVNRNCHDWCATCTGAECLEVQKFLDRLWEYEDAEERGELIWVRKDSVIRRALEDYVMNLNWDLGNRLAHGETIEGLKSEIKLAMDALGEIENGKEE